MDKAQDKAQMIIFYVYVYLIIGFFICVLAYVMLWLIKKKIISYRAAKWTGACAAALTCIPLLKMLPILGSLTMLPLIVGVTLINCVTWYFVFVIYEKREQGKNGGDTN